MKSPSDLSLRLLVKRVRDYAICTLDPNGIITSWNPGAVTMKGYSAEEAIGQHFSMFYPAEEVQRGAPAHNLHLAEAEGVFHEPESIRKRKDGSTFIADVEIIALEEDGHLLGFTKVIRDATRQVELREQLRQANRDLEQFTAIASHDLQEPLRMVSSYLSLLDRHGSSILNVRLKGFLNQALDGANRMSRLITYLLNLSKIGQGELHLDGVELDSIAAQAMQNLTVRIAESHALMTCEKLPKVIGDSGLLVQVFQNLISNGLKFVRPGEPPQVHVSAAFVDDGKRVAVSIRDAGIGLKPEDRERVFRAFERVGGGYAGAGLGLSICQRVIERHHGRIWIESELGVGSTFCFTLQAA